MTTLAIQPGQYTMPTRDYSPVCKASRLASICLSRPDVKKAATFFQNFGLSLISADDELALLRGTHDDTACVIIQRGPARYIGHSLVVDSADDLLALAKAHQVPIQDQIAAIGGQYVELRDPDGLIIRTIHGWNPLPMLPIPKNSAPNHMDQTRRINKTVRMDTEVPPVFKLGHTVLGVSKIAKSLEWYEYNFGLIVSDFQVLVNDPLPTVAFMRFNCGETPTDHHSIALASTVETGHLHTAFELADMDAIVAASRILQKHKYHHTWGIGRHLLGSQIFDYWRDPEGGMFEHYADSDLFDESYPTGYHLMQKGSLHQWGPAASADMLGKIPTLTLVKTLITRLSSDDDLTLRRLINLIKASD